MPGHVIPSSGGGGSSVDTETNFGTAASGEITLGNVNDATSVSVKSGTGGIALASTGTGTMTLSSGGALSIDTLGTDAINLGTHAAAKTITIGNDASTKVDVNAIEIELDSASAMTLSSGGALSIDTTGTADISLGTQNAAKSIFIGNDTTTTSLKLKSGTDGLDLDSTGAISITSGAEINIDSSGITITSDGSTGITIDASDHTNGIISLKSGTSTGITLDGGSDLNAEPEPVLSKILIVGGLPKEDPGTEGQLWTDEGLVMISAGGGEGGE